MGKAEDSVPFRADLRVMDVWREVSGGAEWPERMLCARNLDYVSAEQALVAGDEVAFFPPVTGG